jgi:hypothetical protein
VSRARYESTFSTVSYCVRVYSVRSNSVVNVETLIPGIPAARNGHTSVHVFGGARR